jgi:hypothetical protein
MGVRVYIVFDVRPESDPRLPLPRSPLLMLQGGARGNPANANRPTVQDLSGVRERLGVGGGGAGAGGGAGSRSARPSSARLAQERAQKVAHQKAVDDVRSLPSY